MVIVETSALAQTVTPYDNGIHVTFRDVRRWLEFTPTLRSSHTYSPSAHVAASDESGRAERPLRLLKGPPPQREIYTSAWSRAVTVDEALTGTLERTASIEYLSLLARFIQGVSVC